MSESLRSLRGNERPWANCSRQMSNHEQFAQRKWANERFAQKILVKKSKILFLVCFIYDWKKNLLKNEWIAYFCSFPLFWWAIWAIRSRSLRGNKRSWANRSGCSPKMSEWVSRSFFWANGSFANLWAKNERFARKTYERIPSPANFLFFHLTLLCFATSRFTVLEIFVSRKSSLQRTDLLGLNM